jgi:hypothetical protein
MNKLIAGTYSYEVGKTGEEIKTTKDSILFVISHGCTYDITMDGLKN